MQLNSRSLIPFPAILLTMVLGCAQLQAWATAAHDGPNVGDRPPPLKFSKVLQGPSPDEVTWEKLLGKVVILEFWATWCSPCVKAIPHLNELAEQFKEQPVQFISVTGENEGVVREFIKKHPMNAWLALEDYQEMWEAYRVIGIPHTVLITKDGHIAATAHPANLKAEHIEELLAGKESSLPLQKKYEKAAVEADETSEAPDALFEVSIRPSTRTENRSGANNMWSRSRDRSQFKGDICTIELALLYFFEKANALMVVSTRLPEGYFDIRLKAPPERASELEAQFIDALRIAFGLEVKRTTRETDAFLLTLVTTNAPGLRPVQQPGGGASFTGGFRLRGHPMDDVVRYLEDRLRKPVIDETQLTGLFRADLKWEMSEAELLVIRTDQRIWQILADDPKADLLTIAPPELLQGESLENIKRITAELAKPKSEQFRPDAAAVITAVRERMGLQLTPIRRSIEVLEVNSVDVHSAR